MFHEMVFLADEIVLTAILRKVKLGVFFCCKLVIGKYNIACCIQTPFEKNSSSSGTVYI